MDQPEQSHNNATGSTTRTITTPQDTVGGTPDDVLNIREVLLRRVKLVLQTLALEDAMLFEFVDQWIDNDPMCVLVQIPAKDLSECACAKLEYAVHHKIPLCRYQQCARIVTIGVLKNPAVFSLSLLRAMVSVIQAGPKIFETKTRIAGHDPSTVIPGEIAASHLDHLPKLLLRSPYKHEVIVLVLCLLTMSMCCNNVDVAQLIAKDRPEAVECLLALLRVSLTSHVASALIASRLCLTCLQSLILGAPVLFRTRGTCLQVAVLLGQSADMALQRMRKEGISALHVLELMNATADVIAAFSLLKEGSVLALHPMRDAVSGTVVDHFKDLRSLDAMDAEVRTLFDVLIAYVDELTSAARNPTTERALADVISAVRSLCDHPRAREMIRSRGYIPTIMKIVTNVTPAQSERAQGHALALVLLAMQDDRTRAEFVAAGLLVPIVALACTNCSNDLEAKAPPQLVAALTTSMMHLTEPLKVPPLVFNVQLYALSILVLMLEAESHATLVSDVILFHYEQLMVNALHTCTKLEILTLLLRCVAALALHPEHELVCGALLKAGYVPELLLCASRLLTCASTAAGSMPGTDSASNALGLPAAAIKARVSLALASASSVSLDTDRVEALSYCVQALTSLCAVKQASTWYVSFLELSGAEFLHYLLLYPRASSSIAVEFGPSFQSLGAACALNILAECPAALLALQAAMGGRTAVLAQCRNLSLESDVLSVYHRLVVASESSLAADVFLRQDSTG